MLRRLRLLFLVLSVGLIEAPAFGQEPPCPSPPDCGNLKIEAIRVYPNVATDCNDNADACGDRFSQMFFKVYLRIETAPSSTPFNLDYSMLDVSVLLKNQNSPIQYSYIDAVATDICFKNSPNGTKWYGYDDGDANSVIWGPTEQEVSISFANLTDMTPDCGTSASGKGNKITFTYDKPDCTAACGKISTSCAYVELFTVVVNAYPGEWLYLELGDRMYVPGSAPQTYCDPIGIVNATASQNCYALANPASATALPSTYTSTPNDDMEAELLTPVPDGDGGYDVTVQIKNHSTTESRSIDYIEFLLKATTFQMDRPFTYTGAVPRVLNGGISSTPNELVYYLHYRIDAGGQTLGPGATWAASIVHIGPPTLTNQEWSAELVFADGGTKSRLKTDEPACTALKTTGEAEIDVPGTLLCTNTSVEFFMDGIAGNCVGTSATMRIGLRSTSPPEQLRFRQVKFNLVFDLDPGVTISGVDFTNWPSVSCDPHGCVQLNTCWEVSPDGKTLSYCYLTTIQGSPFFNLDPEQYMVVTFSNTGNGCVRGVTPTLVELAYASQQIQDLITCIPPITPATGLPQCGPLIAGTLATETSQGLEDATVRLKNTCGSATCDPSGACDPPVTANSTQTGFFGFCSLCPDCDKFDVEPYKDNDPLNGVSTFDLVLINKHILGIEPLNSPYKMIAADANNSRSVTTFDIVELRKLILGIYSSFNQIEVAQTSWRFVDAAFTFTNPQNPFEDDPFPEAITCVEAPAADLDFVAVKVGDVNGNAVTNRPESERPVLTLDFGGGAQAKGEAFTVPVTYTGDRPLEAFQMGLRFDPAALELLGPSLGDLPGQTPDHFGLGRAAEGEIRTLWLSPTGDEFDRIAPGTVLFHLSFRALGDLPEAAAALRLDDLVLDNAAWETDGTEYAWAEASPSAERHNPATAATPAALRASVRPNPASGAVQYVVHAPTAVQGRIGLFDAFGKMVFTRRVELVAGEQVLPAPETEALPSGVYIWKVIAEGQKASGHLLKQ